jgi:hypothetical protein
MAEGSAVNELQRITVSPEVAARIVTATNDTDVTALLPRVRVPTLVMHARDDARVPFDAGRRMAAGIPGARLVTLPGRNHLVPSRDGTGLRPVPGAYARVSACKIAIQTNSVEVDDRGYIVIVDRANTGMHILELTGNARKAASFP